MTAHLSVSIPHWTVNFQGQGWHLIHWGTSSTQLRTWPTVYHRKNKSEVQSGQETVAHTVVVDGGDGTQRLKVRES